jgi:hypothetical protein
MLVADTVHIDQHLWQQVELLTSLQPFLGLKHEVNLFSVIRLVKVQNKV